MKSLGPAFATSAPAGKRRWRCVAATGAALALVFFSVVVPFAVLLGLHTRFPSSPYLTPPPKTLPFFYTLAVPLASRIQAFRSVCGREHDLGAPQVLNWLPVVFTPILLFFLSLQCTWSTKARCR